MITEELLVFIRKERKKKVSDLDIRGMLIAHGWTKEQIDEGFNRVDGVVVESDGTPLGGLPKMGDFLRETYTLFKKHIAFLLKLILVTVLYAILLLVVAGAIGALGAWIVSLDLSVFLAVAGAILIIIAILCFFVGMVYLGAFASGGFVFRLLGEVHSMREVRHKVRPFVWKSFLTNALLSLVLIFGYMLFIIPGIFLAIRTIFTKYIVFTENETGRGAIAKSYFYTKGFFWKIVERLAPLVVGTWVLNTVFRAFAESKHLWVLAIPFWFFAIGASLFLAVAMFVLYQHIRTAKGDMVPDEETFATDKKRFMWFAIGGFVLPLLAIGTIIAVVLSLSPAARQQIEEGFEAALMEGRGQQQLQFDPHPESFDQNADMNFEIPNATSDDASVE